MNMIETTETPIIQKIFEIKFSRDYFKHHLKEYHTTSPFAVTDKIPKSRIESTPVTFTAFDPMNGQEYVTTEIIRKDIFVCPITGKEFTEDKLFSQRNRIESDAKRYGYEESIKLNYRLDYNTLLWHTAVEGKDILLSEAQLQDFERNPLELVERIEATLIDLKPSDPDVQ